jgi:hypothetical protein
MIPQYHGPTLRHQRDHIHLTLLRRVASARLTLRFYASCAIHSGASGCFKIFCFHPIVWVVFDAANTCGVRPTRSSRVAEGLQTLWTNKISE